MIDPLWMRIIVGIVIILYIIEFITPIIAIRRRGEDPIGTSTQYSLLAKACLIFTVLWLIICIIYIFFGSLMQYFVPFNFLSIDIVAYLGISLLIMGLILEFLGMRGLGINFRVSLPTDQTQLITSGIYGLIRNPIVLSVFMISLGTFLLIPNLLTLINLIGSIITYDAKVRDEESFLLNTFKQEFEEYRRNVGKYFPKL